MKKGLKFGDGEGKDRKETYSYSRNSRLRKEDLPRETDGTGYNEAFYGKKNRVPKYVNKVRKHKPKYDPVMRAEALKRKGKK